MTRSPGLGCVRLAGWLSILLLAASCADNARLPGTSAGEAVPEEARYGGTAVVAGISDIDDISPLTLSSAVANRFARFVLFMPLVEYDADLRPQPYLARSWELNADSSLLTFHLRNDIFWHDGAKTTAYDVRFTYDRARDPATAYPNTNFWTYYGDAEVVDSFTFRVALRPHAEYLEGWSWLAPVPRHILADVPSAELRRHAFSNRQPVGNGPFEFVSHAPGQSWVFAANEDFPAELGGRPYLDRIVYRVIPEQTTLLTELLTGGIDVYVDPRPDQRARIESSGNARVLSYEPPSYVFIAWNMRRPLFEDARVRRALTMAIDRQGIVDGILYGEGTVANSTVSPMLWNFDPQAGSDLGFDLEGARRLLAQAGWEDRDANGIIENERGEQFRFALMTNQGNQVRADIIAKVQSDLRKVGVIAEPRVVEFGTLLSAVQGGRNRDFDAALFGFATRLQVEDSDFFHCDKVDGRYQFSGLCDPSVDRLIDTLPLIVDRAAAKPLWDEYQRTIARLQPWTMLYYPSTIVGVSNRLRNVSPTALSEMVGAREWWLSPEGRSVQGEAAK